MTSSIYIIFTYCLLRNYSYSQNRMASAGIFVHIVRTDRSIPHSYKRKQRQSNFYKYLINIYVYQNIL